MKPRPIAADAVLLHVGPHKTGTSALQRSLMKSRNELLEHGVLFPGTSRSQASAARAVSASKNPVGVAAAPIKEWSRLVGEVNGASDQRVIVSSEYFDTADAQTARRIADDLGRQRVRIAVTLRPLASVMPSSWQQRVRSKSVQSYEQWLEQIFANARAEAWDDSFWVRQRHDRLIERWAEAVGPQNVHAVVVDAADRLALPQAFERLLGLPAGLLVDVGAGVNRSLSAAEIETVRQINLAFRKYGWSDAVYSRFMRLGAVKNLRFERRVVSGDLKIATPRWALEEAAVIGQRIADGIAQAGVQVIGDLSSLSAVAEASDAEIAPETLTDVPIEAAAAMVVGAMRAGGADLLRERHVTAEDLAKYPGISSAPASLLVDELKRRGRAKITRFVSRGR